MLVSPFTPFLKDVWMYFRPETISLLTWERHQTWPPCSSDCNVHSPSSQSYLEGDLYFVVHSLLQHKHTLLYSFQVPCNDGNTVWTRVWMIQTLYDILGALGINWREPQACFTSKKYFVWKVGALCTTVHLHHLRQARHAEIQRRQPWAMPVSQQ